MKKCVLALLVFLFAAGFAAAEDDLVPAWELWPGALGLSFSSLAGNPGYGIHYHYTVGKFGFSGTLGGYYDPENGLGLDQVLFYSVYTTIQYRVFGIAVSEKVSTQLYTWILGGHIGFMDWIKDVNGLNVATGPYKADFVAGLGIGIELVFHEHLSIPLECGYVGQLPNDKLLSFSFGSGIRYRY